MKKKIRDVSFKEFAGWCSKRACDGLWSLPFAALCTKICAEIYGIKPIFNRQKKREEAWNKVKIKYFNLDSEIEL